jgi:AraC-like DNA-binding protein
LKYSEHGPSPALRPYVDCFWFLEGSEGAEAGAAPILPDGRMELIVNYGDPFQRLRGNVSEIQPRSFLTGQMTGPIVLRPARDAGILGIRFKPGGAYPFFNFPQSEILDQTASLDWLWGRLAREIEERVCAATRQSDKIGVMERILVAKLKTRTNMMLDAAIAEILASDGLIYVEDIARGLGTSRRNLERQFKDHVGIGPKMLARILRFQRIFKTLEENASDRWISIALECGYYDQPHFIREFREFSGKSPAAYFADEAELSRFFTGKL